VLSVTQRGIKIRDIENFKGQLSMDYSKYQIVEEGEYIMNHMDLLTGWVDISKWKGVTSPDYRVFRLKNKLCRKNYYLYIFQLCYTNKIFFGLGQGVSTLGRWRMPAEQFNNFILPIPPHNEQIEIENFIEEKTNLINELIDKQTIIIEKLKEYRQSIISEAVTGKIDVRDWQPNNSSN
jgi:type I restriction enzyme S subunit